MPEPRESDRAFLQQRHYAILATQNEDGSMHLTPVWYLFQGGRLLVGTSASSRKARNIAARPSV
jgi:nitroimidazol reductase NimA-like FMN-containing flavoprotein (pyridoxamine 5'-phosphate oxidase superfamily)